MLRRSVGQHLRGEDFRATAYISCRWRGEEVTRMKRTPLHAEHLRLGARMIEFAGWEMPVQYSGILEEHRCVRSAAGLFDLSHMGELRLRGPQALAALENLTTNQVSRLKVGQAQYTLICTPSGGIVDDVLIYRLTDDDFLAVVNAANTEKDFSWIQTHGFETVANESDQTALVAIQGPMAAKILTQVAEGVDVEAIRPFWFARGKIAGRDCMVSRTGYTGEDGFELYHHVDDAVQLWTALLEAGAGVGLQPAGLGARDTLRLELRYPLYGNDIDETTTPLEAGLQWVVKFDKGPFIGREALLHQATAGIPRRLVGLIMIDRGVPRHGYRIKVGEQEVGHVTSGTVSPTLGKEIAMGYVKAPFAMDQAEVQVEIRGKARTARITEGRFVAPHNQRQG